jgi:hypothetical protein
MRAARRQQATRRRDAALAGLAKRRAALQERRTSQGKAAKRKRRKWPWLVLLVLILLALLPDCDCTPPPPPGAAAGPIETGPAPPPPEILPPEPPTPAHVVRKRDRPAYGNEPAPPLPWLGAFQLQVSARSPRLATCFIGAQRPGSLKWTAAVEPTEGRVSDHTLEPTLLTDALSRIQRTCLIDVLSEPPYRLDESEGRATPTHVSMVIEF